MSLRSNSRPTTCGGAIGSATRAGLHPHPPETPSTPYPPAPTPPAPHPVPDVGLPPHAVGAEVKQLDVTVVVARRHHALVVRVRVAWRRRGRRRLRQRAVEGGGGTGRTAARCWRPSPRPRSPPCGRTEAYGPAVPRRLPFAGIEGHDGLRDARVPHLDAACRPQRASRHSRRGARSNGPFPTFGARLLWRGAEGGAGRRYAPSLPPVTSSGAP